MQKAELLALPPLVATPEMMKVSKEDKPRKETWQYWNSKVTVYIYRYPMYMRCLLSGDILKVSFFSSEAMRLGGDRPLYDVYFDKTRDQFLTWNTTEGKWQQSKLDRLDWPKSVHQSNGYWITPEDRDCINQYLNRTSDPYANLLNYQQEVREKELVARHKRETDPWDAELSQVRPLPKDWLHWVDKVGIPDQFIYYDYRRGGATVGYCSYCEKDVPIHAPRHGKVGRCVCCRHKITFKALGKTGYFETTPRPAYLMQKAGDGFVIREFRVWRRHCKGEHKTPKVNYREVRRSFFSADGHAISAYYWGVYRQTNLRWIKHENVCGTSCGYGGINEGSIYGKTLPQLAKAGLNRTGLMEYLARVHKTDPEFYLAVFNKVPQLEQMAKAQLPAMVGDCLRNANQFHKLFAASPSGSLTHALGINGQELKRLRLHNGSLRYLLWLRQEKSSGRDIPDAVIRWFCDQGLDPDDLRFIFDRMTPVQIQHYMSRQMRLCEMNASQMLTTWKDYLNMAVGFHYDVNDAIVYRTPKLRQRHDELVARGVRKERAVRAGEILKEFPHVDDICASLASKYDYVGERYQVHTPKNVLDILAEGDMLHHCIASSDRYFERIERHESYLLFLRRTEEPESPYYTMEVEPNGTVRQIRTMYDRQNKDIEQARAFLREWQDVVAKRLTQEDYQEAKQSRILREQEFVQMRKDQVRIHTGDLAGRLLVDVLTADLLEAA